MINEQKLFDKLLNEKDFNKYSTKALSRLCRLPVEAVKEVRDKVALHKRGLLLNAPGDYDVLKTKKTKTISGGKETFTEITYYNEKESLDLERLIEYTNLNFKPRYSTKSLVKTHGEGLLYEINLSDFHFGKAAVDDSSTLTDDINRWNEYVEKAIAEIDIARCERILFVLGNDLFHIDNGAKTTTKGTPQDTNSSYESLIQRVSQTLVQSIDKLSEICPVDVVCVRGNHDSYSIIWLNTLLQLYYKDSPVTIISDSGYRQYYRWKDCAFMFTHGDKSDLKTLALTFATEGEHVFKDAKFRNIKLGHFHKEMKLNFDVAEIQTIKFDYIPTVSVKDNYHAQNNYISRKIGKISFYESGGYKGEIIL